MAKPKRCSLREAVRMLSRQDSGRILEKKRQRPVKSVKKAIAKPKLMKYPKTSVPVPVSGRPVRFQSVLSTYTWPDKWVNCVAHRFGKEWLVAKFRKWR